MKLCLKNIGKISSANVEINGITVIAGENNTGKSTVGKTLFAVFNSLFSCDTKIAVERMNSIENYINRLYSNATGGAYIDLDDGDIVRSIMTQANEQMLPKMIKNSIFQIINQYNEKVIQSLSEEQIKELSERIDAVFEIEDDKIFNVVLQRRLDLEFNEQINNVYSTDAKASVILEIKNEQVVINIENDKVTEVINRVNLGTEAIYIDDPFVLDDASKRFWRTGRRYADHRTYLKDKLQFDLDETNVVEEIVVNSKLETIYKKIASVCAGDVVKGQRADLKYKVSGTDTMLDVRNLSTGLKTFVILKMLLQSSQIESNGTIILDEPEIHLHPEWQLVFAELIVLLHTEFGLHVLLTTHSPYFLNAIEVYAAKYGVEDKCNYYLAQNVDGASYVEDVTGNIEMIYRKLARPLQELENERYRND